MLGSFPRCLFFAGALLCSCSAKIEPVYQVELPSGHGLTEQAEVRMKGVKVGQLEQVVGERAVFVPSNKDMEFDASSVWRVSLAGSLGDRFLDVSPGPEGARKLAFGETIRVAPVDPNLNKAMEEKIAKPILGSLKILDALAKVPAEKREEAIEAALQAIEKVKGGAEEEGVRE